MTSIKNNRAAKAIIGIYNLHMTVFIVLVLFFGRDIIIPLSLGILLTFILSPIVTWLEKFIGRIAAVLTVVILIFIMISFMMYILSNEFLDLVSNIQKYKENVFSKIESINFLHNKFFTTFWDKFKLEPSALLQQKAVDLSKITSAAQTLLGSLIHIIIESGFVLLLVIFMLISREGLTKRLIRLFGKGREKTKIAFDDAGSRISQYLLMQLIINVTYGVILGIGLYFIGIPNALLWGALLCVLRFVPYIGTWLAATIPVILSFIISTDWTTPFLTIGFYLILDLLCVNFFEPLLFGSRTGISSTALIISAVFWTLLWGPIGLLLAIPLTVCLVVIGKHVPQFRFLDILLGEDN